jgi:hypothetical protein
MGQEERKMVMDSHVTLPSDDTITLELMEDLYEDMSALGVKHTLFTILRELLIILW